MEIGKIDFEPNIPPHLEPIYHYHDHYNKRTVVVAANKIHSSITTLVYDGVSNIPTDIYEERKDGLKIHPQIIMNKEI